MYSSPCCPCPVSLSGCGAAGEGGPWVPRPLASQQVEFFVHRSLHLLHEAGECGQRPRAGEFDRRSFGALEGKETGLGKGSTSEGFCSFISLAPFPKTPSSRLPQNSAPPCLLELVRLPGSPAGARRPWSSSPCFCVLCVSELRLASWNFRSGGPGDVSKG